MLQVWWWSRIQGFRLNNIKCRAESRIYSLTIYLPVSAQIWTELLSFYQNETLRRITDIAAWNISTCFMDEINKIPTENQQDPGNSTLSQPAGWWDYISKYHTRLTPVSQPALWLKSQCLCQTFICDTTPRYLVARACQSANY